MSERQKSRFNEADRNVVIAWIRKNRFPVFNKIGRRKTYFIDKEAVPHYVLGGQDLWHGIECELLDHPNASKPGSILFFAHKSVLGLSVYEGDFHSLVTYRRFLVKTSHDSYHFNFEEMGSKLRVRECPRLVLTKIADL